MIKLEELRIGNFVYDDYKEIHRVESVSSNAYKKPVILSKIDGLNGFYQSDEIKPTPLSEEWLLKFGFQRFPWGLVKGDLLFKDKIRRPCEELTLEVGNGFRTTVKSVHQLQNLYFSLTGEELTLNEEK